MSTAERERGDYQGADIHCGGERRRLAWTSPGRGPDFDRSRIHRLGDHADFDRDI